MVQPVPRHQSGEEGVRERKPGYQDGRAFAQCMREQGIDMPDPVDEGSLRAAMRAVMDRYDQDTIGRAMSVCGQLMPLQAPGHAATGDDLPAAVTADGLVKDYRGGTRALDAVSFSVGRGEVFAFLGPNGSGKTTTVKILTTLLRPTGGRAMVNGYDPVRQPAEVRRSIGVVFQETSLDDDLTAWENLDFHGVLYDVPRDARKKRNEELLSLVGLWDRRDSLVGRFSGGLKRRLEIARAFVHRPRVLFLDEPTVGLDPQTRLSIWSNLAERSRINDTTIFFTTHYMEEAERAAHRIAIVDDGKIIASGTPDELKSATGTATLEDAFLALTGKAIREEPAGGAERVRPMSGHGAGRH